MGKLISSSEITKKYNLSYQTLNYYTNLGLLETVKKEGNKRFYNEDTVKVNLEKIQAMKNEGYTLALIRKRLIS
ncbi:MAG: MerR family transcriptional regulator [Candidatus Gastranaerophilales bacterium]|jgi:DNA-binding transcriptional MerR regulator|nr:MerR family transcriptional regulator [Candidatus Gastranaerophilales bacterium]